MKITDLNNNTFANILKIDDPKLKNLSGYDLDTFAQDCGKGKIIGVAKGITKASVDILYVDSDMDLYKIEGKDLSKLLTSKIKGYFSNEITLAQNFIYGMNKPTDKPHSDDEKQGIDMLAKIAGTKDFLEILEDSKLYSDKGYILLINYEFTDSWLESKLEIDRIELEYKLLKYKVQLDDLKALLGEILDKQNEKLNTNDKFDICDISSLIDILQNK